MQTPLREVRRGVSLYSIHNGTRHEDLIKYIDIFLLAVDKEGIFYYN